MEYNKHTYIHNLYNIARVKKKVLGKMKDENNCKIITEFVGLRSKMYPLRVEHKLTRKGKGIKKRVIEKRTL